MILIIAEPSNGKINKGGFELATYAKLTAQKIGGEVHALVIGESSNAGELGKYGADKVHTLQHANLANFDSQTYTHAIASVVESIGAKLIIVRSNANGKSIEGRLAVRLNAGSVSGVNAVPDTTNGFQVNKSVYSGKAIATYTITSDVKVLSLMGNAVQPQEFGSEVSPQTINIEVPAPVTKVISRHTETGTIPLPEAEKVVSAGRGMKGPENWGMIEELAGLLGAATACSKPTADMGWRPHHEHVGQTGIQISPNVYFAIGISGAIQHLAGVSSSKTIIVINKDSEAPFFKIADYGVVGDLFEVVPKLIAAVKRQKGL